MKIRFLTIFLLAMAVVSCQDAPTKKDETKQEKTTTTDSLQIIQAEYIYVDSAAVLKGRSFIYGVKLDSTARALGKRVNDMKQNPYDMVPVLVKGVVRNNEEIGWDKIVEIKQVLQVMEPRTEEVIQIKDKNDSKGE